MTDAISVAAQLEQLVAELFSRSGRKNVRANRRFTAGPGRHYEIDIQYGDAGNTTVVEVKRYRYSSPPPWDLFSRALYKIDFLRSEAKASNAILVMSCPLTERLRAAATQYPDVDIWDARKLLGQAAQFPDLLERLATLLEVNVSGVLEGPVEIEDASQRLIERSKGEELARALTEIAPGRADAYAFEEKCIEALKYLFDQDLFGWHEQHGTEDGLHRRDLVCRILPNAEVWKLMLTDLKSRYIIFEFKNYSGPVSQREIVTTERYLYPTALRNLAIIISPHGCSPSAMQVIQGAMREQGKLILSLSVSELVSLLVGKDQGSDPNAYLFDRIDDFLMSLGR